MSPSSAAAKLEQASKEAEPGSVRCPMTWGAGSGARVGLGPAQAHSGAVTFGMLAPY